MTLLEILVRELPKHGGWPQKWHQCAQDGSGEVCFFTIGKIHFRGFFNAWSIPADSVAQHDGKARFEALLADDYAETIITREQYESALAAVEPEWNGEGLPPVGCECQYRKHKKSEQSEWFNGVVKYASEFTVVIQPACYAGETIGHPDNFEFRTIPSEDDIKRDASIKAIFDVLTQYDSLKGCHTYEGKADYLYSAIASGKIPHISIDHTAE